MTEPSASTPLIVTSGAAKGYPGVQALAPLTVAIGPGERVALAGPSGSGKTTLLYLLAGIVRPDSGEILLDGQPISELRPGRPLARLVGIIHQQYDLVPNLPVIHNVLAGRLGEWGLGRSMISLLWPRDRYLAQIALARLGIADKLQERTSRLSGGEQQRVAMARLMVQSPKVILADEPVSSLDPARAEDILRLLTDLVDSSGRALIASMHAPYLIRKHFTRVIGLRRGLLQFDIPSEELTEETLGRLYELDHNNPEEVGAEAQAP